MFVSLIVNSTSKDMWIVDDHNLNIMSNKNNIKNNI